MTGNGLGAAIGDWQVKRVLVFIVIIITVSVLGAVAISHVDWPSFFSTPAQRAPIITSPELSPTMPIHTPWNNPTYQSNGSRYIVISHPVPVTAISDPRMPPLCTVLLRRVGGPNDIFQALTFYCQEIKYLDEVNFMVYQYTHSLMSWDGLFGLAIPLSK